MCKYRSTSHGRKTNKKAHRLSTFTNERQELRIYHRTIITQWRDVKVQSHVICNQETQKAYRKSMLAEMKDNNTKIIIEQ